MQEHRPRQNAGVLLALCKDRAKVSDVNSCCSATRGTDHTIPTGYGCSGSILGRCCWRCTPPHAVGLANAVAWSRSIKCAGNAYCIGTSPTSLLYPRRRKQQQQQTTGAAAGAGAAAACCAGAFWWEGGEGTGATSSGGFETPGAAPRSGGSVTKGLPNFTTSNPLAGTLPHPEGHREGNKGSPHSPPIAPGVWTMFLLC